MAAEIWLTEKYYREFHERLDSLFSDTEAIDVYEKTQLLQQKWPSCIGNPPPDVGSRRGLFYVKFDWPHCRLRICFGAESKNGTQKIVVLTCRSKQELSKGSADGTQEWYRHMATVGAEQWDLYRSGKLSHWKIY